MDGATGTSIVVVTPGHRHGRQHRPIRTTGSILTVSELHPRTIPSFQAGVEFQHTRHAATSRHAAIGPEESPAAATFGCMTREDAGVLMEDT